MILGASAAKQFGMNMYFASKLEKILKKIIPLIVSFFVVPFPLLMITIPLAFWVIGPVMNEVSSLLSTAVMAVYNFSPVLGGLVLKNKMKKSGAVTGAIAGIFKSTQYAFGGSGLLGIPCFVNPKGLDSGFYGVILSDIVGLAIAFILTIIVMKKDQKTLETF